MQTNPVIAVVGLGYVGLPLAIEFGKQFRVIGFDLSARKIESYRSGIDPAGDTDKDAFDAAVHLSFTAETADLVGANYFIIAVPTPVDKAHQPDFSPLVSASHIVAQAMGRGATIVYESTVYPGATEEICIPILEEASGLEWKKDFHVGYSPERINPGDRTHTLTKVVKVVSGDDLETLEKIANLYQAIVRAGVYRAPNIKTAEAAKVIENTQRDINIALMNELAIIFNLLGIDTQDVLEAAATKWNFLSFRPGLVGGHCIGVDPYYLTYKAEVVGYLPQIILAGRRINDGMGKFVAEQTIKQMIANGSHVKGATVNILGLTFKENCPDLRNSKVYDLIRELESYGVNVFVHDPIADPAMAQAEYGITLTAWKALPGADAIVLAVAHQDYMVLKAHEYLAIAKRGACFIDVKSQINVESLNSAGFSVWRL